MHLHRLGAVLLLAVLHFGAARPVRRRRAIFCWPGAGPTRAAVRAGRCALNTTTSPTRLSPPPPCAGRRSGRPGAAASRPGAVLHFHQLGAVLLRAGRRPGRAVRPDAGRRPGGEVRLEYDLVVAVSPAVGCLQTGRCGALTRILVGAAVVAGPGRLHCHLRRRAPAAGAAGPAPPLRAAVVRRRAAGRWSGRPGAAASVVRPEYDHVADSTATSAAVRRPPERPARRRRFAPGGDLVPPPAQRRAPAGCPPCKGRAP